MDDITKFFRSIFTSKKPTEDGAPLSHLRQDNPYNEIQLLTAHSDIIRAFVHIGVDKFASCADDGLIVIWDTNTGEKVLTLVGHTKPVTCLLPIKSDSVLVSGSVDKSLRFWNINTGACIKVIPNSHDSSVKCLISISSQKFCSGGNDRFLCIWDTSGEFIGRIERQEEENLNCLLAISKDRVVTSSSSALLLVYDTNTFKFCNLFTYHRESVQCLVKVNTDVFASGSLDGVIVIWRMGSLTPLKKLNYPEKFFTITDTIKSYTSSVNHLLVLGSRYLAACIGKGFQVYDTTTGDCVMDCPNAHDSNVNSIISVAGGTRLITCSSDGRLKLWGSTIDFNFEGVDPEYRTKLKRKGFAYYPPTCLGEMYAHTDAITQLIQISETAFISGGHDALIVIWREGEEQNLLRNQVAAQMLLDHNRHIYTDDDDNGSADSSTGDAYISFSEDSVTSSVIDDYLYDSSEIRRESVSPSTTPGKSVSAIHQYKQRLGAIQQNDEQKDGPGVGHNDGEGEQQQQQPQQELEEKSQPPAGQTIHHAEGVDTVVITKGDSSASLPTESESSSSSREEQKVEAVESDNTTTTTTTTTTTPTTLSPDAPLTLPMTPLVMASSKGMEALGKPPTPVKVPSYIMEFARDLYSEQNLSIDEVRENLLNEGHSEVMIEAIINILITEK